MGGSEKVSGTQSQSQVQSVLSSSVGPKSLKRKSSMMGYHSDVSNDVKIELKAPQKTTLTTVLKKEEKLVDGGDKWNRIANTDKLLKNNNAITDAERAWLKNLRINHKAQYNQLGDMLKVHIFRHGSRHGVSGTENRNKIRMQILKAAVHEAMKTASLDVTAGDKKRTINNALKAAQETRSAMFKSVAFGFRKLRAYNDVTTETLQNPELFKEKYDCKLANLELFRAVQWPRSTLSSGISWRDQKRARAAVELLVNNNLLTTAKAASTLLRRLREEPLHITEAFSDLTPKVEPRSEREKVRAMALLALAYNPPDIANKMRKDLSTQIDVNDNPLDLLSGDDSSDISSDDGRSELVQSKFSWFCSLPRSGVPSQQGRGMQQPGRDEWLDWADPNRKLESASFDQDKLASQNYGDDNSPSSLLKPADGNFKEDIDLNENLLKENPKARFPGMMRTDDGDNSSYGTDVLDDYFEKGAEPNKPTSPYISTPQTSPSPGPQTSPSPTPSTNTSSTSTSSMLRLVELKLDLKDEDDVELLDSMRVLGPQQWSKAPLGSNQRVQPSDTAKEASDGLNEALSDIKLIFETAFDESGVAKPNETNLASMVIPRSTIGLTKKARSDAKALKDELEFFLAILPQKSSNLSRQEITALKDDIAKNIAQLNAIAKHSDLVFQHLADAEDVQTGPTDNNNNNVE